MQVNILLRKYFKVLICKRDLESKEEYSLSFCGAEVI